MLGTIIFGFGLFVLLVAVIVAIGFVKAGAKGIAAVAVLAGLLIGGAMLVGPMVGTVDTKKVGVVTSFKKPTGEVKDAGGYLIAPWKSVTEMDAAKQTDPYTFEVQLSGGSKAMLTVFPSWTMVPSAAPELFQDYKDFDNMTKSLWEQQLKSTANNIFSVYNPVTDVDPKTGNLKKSKDQWSSELKSALEVNPLIKGRLIIDSLSIPTIQPDDNTQKNLNDIVAEFARGRLLEQQKANAQKEKEITSLNAQVDKATRCLEIAQKNGTDPGTCGLFEGNSNTNVLISPKTK